MEKNNIKLSTCVANNIINDYYIFHPLCFICVNLNVLFIYLSLHNNIDIYYSKYYVYTLIVLFVVVITNIYLVAGLCVQFLGIPYEFFYLLPKYRLYRNIYWFFEYLLCIIFMISISNIFDKPIDLGSRYIDMYIFIIGIVLVIRNLFIVEKCKSIEKQFRSILYENGSKKDIYGRYVKCVMNLLKNDFFKDYFTITRSGISCVICSDDTNSNIIEDDGDNNNNNNNNNNNESDRIVNIIEDDINMDTFIKLRCGHCYHSLCIIKWIVINSSCPLCRAIIFDINLS